MLRKTSGFLMAPAYPPAPVVIEAASASPRPALLALALVASGLLIGRKAR